MSSMINFKAEQERHIKVAWEAYCGLPQKVEETLAVTDGTAAGRAWRHYPDLLKLLEQHNSLSRTGEFVSLRRQIG